MPTIDLGPAIEIVRPVFSDGERLTARRLNAALEYLRGWLRRLSLGPLSQGIAFGLTVSSDSNGEGLLITPGIAIDGRGRLVVLSTVMAVSRGQIEDQVQDLNDGDIIRVGIGVGDSASPLDPCAGSGHDIREDPRVFLRKLTPGTGTSAAVNVGNACVFPFTDLDAVASGPDGCSVELGTATVQPGGSLSVSVASRQGIAPRFDALRNSYSQVVAELRSREGTARVLFVAPAGGPSVQATRIASNLDDDKPAARYSPVSSGVLEFAGGTAVVVPPSYGGVAAVPVAVSASVSITAPMSRGTIVQLADDPPPNNPIPTVEPCGDAAQAFGIVAGEPYRIGPDRVVPIAVAGLVDVVVTVGAETPAGTRLTALGGPTGLRIAAANDPVIAVLGRRMAAGAETVAVFVVHPPYPAPVELV